MQSVFCLCYSNYYLLYIKTIEGCAISFRLLNVCVCVFRWRSSGVPHGSSWNGSDSRLSGAASPSTARSTFHKWNSQYSLITQHATDCTNAPRPAGGAVIPAALHEHQSTFLPYETLNFHKLTNWKINDQQLFFICTCQSDLLIGKMNR